eukprot:CAMPEP_0177660124 /NCGR_PEP_ID=MMETSP0447-20121125/17840_1 /TAXON_ID=0 /ORGANISM="Stygamoeba regulata, Strain BSH-02190019" /LENGTH=260 /DNA_ID=CAMNT_0019165103 /DNA_START=115 /DNA_END=897 /DNA_ORIENTATION=-
MTGPVGSRAMVSAEEALPGRTTAEQLSNKHVVLGTPYRPPFPSPNYTTAVFATGCYWGAEKGFWKMPGVFSTAVGYCGGYTKNPTYEEVCTGMTGHTESVLVVYDPALVSYADLLRQFWECHNPTQFQGQGNDHGTQYRSAVYCNNNNELQLAIASKEAYQRALKGETIHTEIELMEKAGPFYYAHEAYQQYLARPGSRPYCSAEPQGVSLPPFASWAPPALQASHAPRLPEPYWEKHGPRPGCTIKGPNIQNRWPEESL